MYRFYAAYCMEQSLLSAIEQKDDESIMQSGLKKFHTILGLELKSRLAANSNSVCIDLTMTDVTKVDGKTFAETGH